MNKIQIRIFIDLKRTYKPRLPWYTSIEKAIDFCENKMNEIKYYKN